MNDNILLDNNFLTALSEQKERDIFARITALDINENPIEQIEGKITSGSVNIDGESSIRRTCSLTMISKDIDTDYYWAIKTKFKLEIGLRNRLTGDYAAADKYPEIVWFPQGIYVITSFNTSISASGCTISISGKDKMCLLNGELGGQLYSSIDFGNEEIKETIMEPVEIELTNSDIIMQKKYYVKMDGDIFTLPQITHNTTLYSFIYNQESGNYRKENDIYIPTNDNEEERENSPYKYYNIYKLIKNPEDAFKPIKFISDYESNKYYYLKDDNYYVLDLRKNSNDIQYYQLKTLYTSYENVTKEKRPINKIIRDAIHEYAKEPYQNIIIKDLEKYGLEQLTYKGDTPIYGLYDISSDKFVNLIFEENNENFSNLINSSLFKFNPLIDSITSDVGSEIFIKDNDFLGIITEKDSEIIKFISCGIIKVVNDYIPSTATFLNNECYLVVPSNLPEDEDGVYYVYYNENGDYFNIRMKIKNRDEIGNIFQDKIIMIPSQNSSFNNEEDKIYTVVKIDYGDDIGYRLTDLTYTGDLVTNVGESLTSMLDKIKQMLGNFEYFYDINGKFIFQEKRNYANTTWSQIIQNENEMYVDFANNKSKFSYNFQGNNLISSLQNSPALTNLKNDFVVWGKRKSLFDSDDIPIHGRYALDKKPNYYKSLDGKIYLTDEQFLTEEDIFKFKEYLITENKSIFKNINSFNEQFSGERSYTSTSIKFLGDNDEIKKENNILLLNKPIMDENINNYGIYSEGWWDIRDWVDYYKILKNTKEKPNGTMKFYSTDGTSGYVQVKNFKTQYNGEACTWLMGIESTGGIDFSYSFEYVSEDESLDPPCLSYYHESSKNKDGIIKTSKIENVKKYFKNPIKWDKDEHTYLWFLNEIGKEKQVPYNDSTYYIKSFIFYNPTFPFGETAKDLINSRVKQEYFKEQENIKIFLVDWREIIYQMAMDFYKAQGCSKDSPIYIFDNNSNMYQMTSPEHLYYEIASRNPDYYPTGCTGYEQYYADMQGFWRELYNPDYIPEEIYSDGEYINNNGVKKWSSPELIDYQIKYYIGLNKEKIRKQYEDLESLMAQTDDANRYNELYNLKERYERYLVKFDDDNFSQRLYWNRAVFEQPETLNFWIEFLDSDQELGQFQISKIGDRTKVINDDKANAIIYSNVPNIILYNGEERLEETREKFEDIVSYETPFKSGYQFMNVPNSMMQYFTISYRTHSVKDKIDELLYQHSYCSENITITALPIYYLEPNTRIYVKDEDTGIDGEYIISKINYPLSYNGTMSVTATKAPSRLY